MSDHLKYALLIFGLCLLLMIIQILRKKKMPIKYSLIWFFSALVILFVVIFPNFMLKITNFIGFVAMSNMIIGIILVLLLIITISLTIIVSGQKEQIRTLVQEISLLKENQKRSKK